MIRTIEQMDREMSELRALVADVHKSVNKLQVDKTTLPSPTAAEGIGALINLLPNSDLNFSVDAWDTAPAAYPAGGDISFEAKHWFRFPDTETDIVESSANALKAVGHSLFAANEGANPDIPRWDKVNGWVEIGSIGATNWMLATPFIVNHAKPSSDLQFQFIAKLMGEMTFPDSVSLGVGVFDNSPGQQKIIEGGDIALTGGAVGASGGTSREYLLIATTDFGQQYKSNLLTVANSPAALTPANYIALSWTRIAGVTNYDLYRNTGGVIIKIAQIRNGQTSFWDQGAEIETVSAYPSVTLTKARAYTQISGQSKPTNDAWKPYGLSVIVPQNYNSGLTLGKQWLILKLTGAAAESRQVKLDRFGLGYQYGAWSPSFYDSQVKNNVSTSAASSDQGTVGTGTGGDVDPGTGGEIYYKGRQTESTYY